MIKEIRGIIRKGRRYFQDFYNYFEIIIIGFSLASFSMYFYRMNESNYIRKSLNQNSNDLSKTFINLQYVTTCDSLLNKFLGFCAAFATLRFIKIFRFNKRIIVFMVSFKRSLLLFNLPDCIIFFLLLALSNAPDYIPTLQPDS